MKNLVELRDLLINTSDFQWNDSLFLPNGEKWDLNSSCYLFDIDELDDNEEIPNFAVENNYCYVLNVADIQDIVVNVKQQRAECSES
ncbi:hypothetical protein V7146_11605 [Gottfriedia acidiceleris]|uniref:DUF7716 domain-containing protein n=1 Tax=Gottfriedia acidiceleris TaxID=371036 RepID=UPI00300055AA